MFSRPSNGVTRSTYVIRLLGIVLCYSNSANSPLIVCPLIFVGKVDDDDDLSLLTGTPSL